MSTARDPDVILATWLEDGPVDLSPSTRRAIKIAARTTPQARGGYGPFAWRPQMSRFAVFAGAAAVIAVLVGVLAVGLPGSLDRVTVPPTAAAPSPAVVPTPAQAQPSLGPLPSPVDTTGWKTDTSARYGFQIQYPPSWDWSPPSEDWTVATASLWPNPGWEHFRSPDASISIGVFSVPVASGTTVESWLATVCPGYTGPCDGIADRSVQLTMDGHPGLLVPFADDLQFFSVVGDRMYVIASGRPAGQDDSLRLVESFLSTMQLVPGGAVPAAPMVGSLSVDTSSWIPYTSVKYGTGANPLTISHPANWTVTPATRSWSFDTDIGAALPGSAGADTFTSPDGRIRVGVWTVPLATGASIGTWNDVETWAQAYCEKTMDLPCTGIPQRSVPMCIERRDCHPAVIVPFQDDVQAFGTGGSLPDGMVVVAVWLPETDPSVAAYGGSQRLLTGFLSTMGVVQPSSSDNHP